MEDKGRRAQEETSEGYANPDGCRGSGRLACRLARQSGFGRELARCVVVRVADRKGATRLLREVSNGGVAAMAS